MMAEISLALLAICGVGLALLVAEYRRPLLAVAALLLACTGPARAGYDQWYSAAGAFDYTGGCTSSGFNPHDNTYDPGSAGVTVPRCTDAAGSFKLLVPLKSNSAAAPQIQFAHEIINRNDPNDPGVSCWRASPTAKTHGAPLGNDPNEPHLTFPQTDEVAVIDVDDPPECNLAQHSQCISALTAGIVPFDAGADDVCAGGLCASSEMVVLVERVPSSDEEDCPDGTADTYDYSRLRAVVP